MTYLIRRDRKTKWARLFVTPLLCVVAFGGCGSVVKNPTRPKPSPAQSESFGNLVSGMIAEVLELMIAAEASLKTSKPKVGFECSTNAEGTNILFKGTSQYTESLTGNGGLRSFAVEDSQEHTHRWSALTDSSAKPTCAADKGLEQSVLDLNGLKLSYDFIQNTKIVADNNTILTNSYGQRNLSFAETTSADESRKSYQLDVESQTIRSVNSESFDLKLLDSTTVFTYEKNTASWSQKDFAGVFESSFEGKTQELSFDGASLLKGDKAKCFPNSGLLRGSMVTADNQSFNFNVDFASEGIPQLQFDGVDEKTELKVLNCIN